MWRADCRRNIPDRTNLLRDALRGKRPTAMGLALIGGVNRPDSVTTWQREKKGSRPLLLREAEDSWRICEDVHLAVERLTERGDLVIA